MKASDFKELVEETINGANEPILVCNDNMEVCEIPRFVLRGIYNGFCEIIDGANEEDRIEQSRIVFDAVCCAADKAEE